MLIYYNYFNIIVIYTKHWGDQLNIKRLERLLLTSLLIISLCSCTNTAPKAQKAPNNTNISTDSGNNSGALAIYDKEKSIKENITAYIKKMTLEEKVGQMIMAERNYVTAQDVKTYSIGSVFAQGGSAPEENNPDGWRKMILNYKTAAKESRLSIPLLFAVDAVHGNNNMKDTVIYPHNIALGATRNGKLAGEIGGAVADELNSIGVDWTFAPCVAVSNDIRWGRAYECFSETPDLVTMMSTPFIAALQEKGIIACAKHYVADGAVEFGSGMNGLLDRGNTNISTEELKDKYISVFKDAVKAGVKSVMVSYSSVKGRKNHSERDLIEYKLKQDIGFQGVVISDYEGVEYLDGNSLYVKVVNAVNAGIDVLMEGKRWKESYKCLLEAASEKRQDINMDRIDEAVFRILRVKMESDKFDVKGDKTNKNYDIRQNSNVKIAEQAVEESLVLLKNKKNILPLKKSAKIAVIGPASDNIGVQCGGWTKTWQGGLDIGDKKWMRGTTILDGFKEMADEGRGVIITDPAKIRDAEVVVAVLGEHPYAEGKGDEKNIGLSEGLAFSENAQTLQIAYESKKPVVVIIVSGRPRIITSELNRWDALVEAWLPGTEGRAVASVIYGDNCNFKGRLPVSWPKSSEQLPITIEKLDNNEEYNALFQYGFSLKYSN